ncbi:MAG: 3-methyl-2-oxobutanoate hydroxymethyltransferase [Dehalococcoidales bacterium]|jgi:3-methyl-2-oxobutanoate hydroxymethyltransferase|nr:3-methyl-2-oxobutanoate hydroxymethyltransferase [Dehalococcoidales bacterium]MDP7416279.1 3-methyl-2-oxobutanoate hydroxymethyltransferase [Dehalococcoidales bacterium]
MKKSILNFHEMKKRGEKITYITAYDFPMASFVEKAGIDMILVGDSAGMLVHGYSGTVPMTMDQMVAHAEDVRRGAPNTFVIGDLPFLSYQLSAENAIYNSGRFYKEASVDAVKLEGGRRLISQIKGIVDSGMSVMGHIGLTPQSSGQLGGFKAQGLTVETAMELLQDAAAVEKAGAFALLVEAVPPEVGKIITETVKIPVLGIGAGMYTDGQVLINGDILGMFEAFTPKFVKRYANMGEIIVKAFTEYAEDIRSGKFPEEKHCYRMLEGEHEKLQARLKKGPIQ